ncbi:MAG TPA: GYDIA family GHMP kinase [Chitinophagales bacterium]|nr:GYDIA family GHMP kinase [Chitinophagales bacterium]
MKVRLSSQSDTNSYYGHGKLLITGEYFVLDGAEALAVPTRFGQSLRVKELHSTESLLYWVALNNQGKVWLNLVFDTVNFKCLNSTGEEALRLGGILATVRALSPGFLNSTRDFAIETRLEFPNQWGLGTSSTLIHCMASWAGIDGYELLKSTIGGSGYDVACAAHDQPILYTLHNGKPETLPLNWCPSFSHNIYFAYLGKKQLSSEAIKYYREKLNDKTHAVNELSYITQSVLKCNTLPGFEQLISAHENIIASHLKLLKIQDTVFADYWGVAKSLGAWGGDFVMLTNTDDKDKLHQYLAEKQIDTVFSWEELILPQSI